MIRLSFKGRYKFTVIYEQYSNFIEESSNNDPKIPTKTYCKFTHPN